MKAQRFKARAIKKGAGVVIPVPFDPNEAWGEKERHYITGSVGGCGVRGVLELKDGSCFLSLGAAWVRDMPLPTTEIEVELLPEGPQIGQLSDDVEEAFAAAPEARRFFESLATFYRTGFIKPIEDAKRPSTRAARITEMIGLLNAGKKQK